MSRVVGKGESVLLRKPPNLRADKSLACMQEKRAKRHAQVKCCAQVRSPDACATINKRHRFRDAVCLWWWRRGDSNP